MDDVPQNVSIDLAISRGTLTSITINMDNINITVLQTGSLLKSLIMFGILLGLIRVNFKTISYGIGIHSGFVFTIKTFKSNSSLNLDSDYIHFLSNYDKFTGHLSTIWITTLILFYLIFIYKKK